MKILSLALAFVLTFGLTTLQADHHGTELAAVKKANADFYAALNAMFTGDLKPMEAIWSHAADVSYLPPDKAMLVGWAQVKADWEKQATLKLGGKVEPRDEHILLGKDLAIVQCVEEGENVNVGNQPKKVSIRATNVYRLENGTWKMISHHADPLPFLEKK